MIVVAGAPGPKYMQSPDYRSPPMNSRIGDSNDAVQELLNLDLGLDSLFSNPLSSACGWPHDINHGDSSTSDRGGVFDPSYSLELVAHAERIARKALAEDRLARTRARKEEMVEELVRFGVSLPHRDRIGHYRHSRRHSIV
jgi:hypothetical protein